jgi:hypothetical protein
VQETYLHAPVPVESQVSVTLHEVSVHVGLEQKFPVVDVVEVLQ